MKNLIDSAAAAVSVTNINELRKDAQIIQKKGAPYMMASVIIWIFVTIVRFLPLSLYGKNFLTFCGPMLLVPLALMFSKMIGADIFKRSDNPVNKLGIICTCNQILYILIVMWAFSKDPEAMLMIFAMVFGAHLLPFSWVYESRTYLVMSILETVGALLVASLFGDAVMGVFMVVCQIITSVLLLRECRKLPDGKTAAVDL